MEHREPDRGRAGWDSWTWLCPQAPGTREAWCRSLRFGVLPQSGQLFAVWISTDPLRRPVPLGKDAKLLFGRGVF